MYALSPITKWPLWHHLISFIEHHTHLPVILVNTFSSQNGQKIIAFCSIISLIFIVHLHASSNRVIPIIHVEMTITMSQRNLLNITAPTPSYVAHR